MENDTTISCLEHILQIINDGKYGYINASEDVSDATLKVLFLQYSEQRASFSQELKHQILKLGGETKDQGDTLGALHRTWMDIKSNVSGGDRDAILKACITGEEKALDVFNDEMKNISDQDILDLLFQQSSAIKLALNNIRTLENTLSNT